ncbi:TonB-dependent receptor [Dyadobacter fanqingshengii]|uniref:TonB-dependent receptor n=1 Tax=Dyadobacter fanqingshengii TaxID=2906443 RepID=A0A9X1P7Z7_9BACT|nr:TonB-dependent receptor [Dyadobacter fanqingshengii]MCF0039299.1 TonB-dependent receptor [Dyadobacter fanqingshengii]USJ33884.1 TonB-dependent receptor [Dyadobacter fanqingshengii]
MLKIYTFLLIILSASALLAQNGRITGQILSSDGQPAEQVSVGIKGSSKGSVSDAMGKFVIERVKPGTYSLLVSFVGLETQEKSVEVIAGETVNVSFALSESANQLSEVIVKGGNPYKSDQVSSSLKLLTPILETPQNVQVVTSKVLADQQIISMSDGLIRNVSGATRLEHWGDMYANITMRGSQIQAFRNGFNVVSSFWGPLTEDMSFVDHIEFVKGPAGFMLANGDPSGLYNVVTKKPTGETKGELSLTMGSFDFYRATLDLDGKLDKSGKLLYRLNIAGQNKNSHRSFEYNNRYSIAPVISYQLDDKTKLTAEYNMQYAKMSDVGSYYVFTTDGYATLPRDFTAMPPGLDPTKIKDQSLFVNLQHQINSDWKVTAQVGYFNYQQTGSSMWPDSVSADARLVRSVGIWDAKSEMTLAQAFINGSVTTGGVQHRILGGIDIGTKNYFADWAQSHALDTLGGLFDPRYPYYGTPNNGYPVWDRTLNLEARAVMGGGTMDQKYTGIYLQDELGFIDNKIRLTLAGRYTHVSQSAWGGSPDKASHFTPRVGLSISLDKNTSVYALYDEAFLPQSGKLRGGGTAKPITGSNRELGFKRDWAEGRWNTTLSFYRIVKNNEITADPLSPANSGLSVVLGQKRAQGVEFDIRGTIAKGLNLTANYAYTNSEVTKVTEGVQSIKVGDVIPGFAKHNVNGWLSYKIQQGALKGTGLSGGFTYLIDRATSNWSTTNNEQNLPNYFKLDGGVFWERDKIRLTLNVFNVLDKYLYSGSYYDYLGAYYTQSEAPRNYRLGLAYKF